MSKKYEDEDGNYLIIDKSGQGYGLWWYIPAEDDIGTDINEKSCVEEDTQEGKIIWNVIQGYVKENLNVETFVHNGYFGFVKRAHAVEALKRINAALLSGNILPDWAIKATAAGWTAPDGWKP